MQEGQHKLLSTKEVALILGCHIDTLSRWRAKKYGPMPVRVGRKWKYKKEAIDRFLTSQDSIVEDFLKGEDDE